MPSDLQMPQPAYRQFRRSAAVDPATRRLALIAAGVGAAFVLGVGGWMALGHHRQAGVPLVLADTHPVRVKPENPGGMQVIGANDEMLRGASGSGKDAVAPAPEAPQLEALQQEIQAAKGASAAPPSVPTRSAPPLAARATRVVAARPAAPSAAPPGLTPAPTPAAAASASVAAPIAAKPGAGSGAAVQVAALGSEAAAKVEWERLGRRAPALLGGRKPLIQRAEVAGHTVYRLRIAGFADTAAATEFCGQLRARGGSCSIGDF